MIAGQSCSSDRVRPVAWRVPLTSRSSSRRRSNGLVVRNSPCARLSPNSWMRTRPGGGASGRATCSVMRVSARQGADSAAPRPTMAPVRSPRRPEPECHTRPPPSSSVPCPAAAAFYGQCRIDFTNTVKERRTCPLLKNSSRVVQFWRAPRRWLRWRGATPAARPVPAWPVSAPCVPWLIWHAGEVRARGPGTRRRCCRTSRCRGSRWGRCGVAWPLWRKAAPVARPSASSSWATATPPARCWFRGCGSCSRSGMAGWGPAGCRPVPGRASSAPRWCRPSSRGNGPAPRHCGPPPRAPLALPPTGYAARARAAASCCARPSGRASIPSAWM